LPPRARASRPSAAPNAPPTPSHTSGTDRRTTPRPPPPPTPVEKSASTVRKRPSAPRSPAARRRASSPPAPSPPPSYIRRYPDIRIRIDKKMSRAIKLSLQYNELINPVVKSLDCKKRKREKEANLESEY
jgi:hypothetical protein